MWDWLELAMSKFEVRVLKNGAITLPAAIRRQRQLSTDALIDFDNRPEGVLVTFQTGGDSGMQKSQ